MRILTFLFVLITSFPTSAVEISNFKSGLACTHTKLSEDNEPGWICQPTVDVLVTDQGACTYNGQKKLCTWIGFEFDYKDSQAGTELQCSTTTSEPINDGNPNEISGKNLKSMAYTFPLKIGSGHFFNPQYYVFNVRTKGARDALIIQQTTCRVDGKLLFEYQFNLKFPTIDSPQV